MSPGGIVMLITSAEGLAETFLVVTLLGFICFHLFLVRVALQFTSHIVALRSRQLAPSTFRLLVTLLAYPSPPVRSGYWGSFMTNGCHTGIFFYGRAYSQMAPSQMATP